MDWNLFWQAAGVIVSLSSVIFLCFRSLSSSIEQINNRLTNLEGRIIVIETILSMMGMPLKDKGKHS